jgi:phosphatidylserine decarboxylase
LAPLLVLVVTAVLSVLVGGPLWTPILLAATVLATLAFMSLLVFFRDPPREVGRGVVSPADGKVMAADPDEGKVSIFMRVQDVHVNRAPLAGVVTSMEYHRGSHVPAFRKDSHRNERLRISLATEHGLLTLTQVAGMVARRIVPYVIEGDRVRRGQRIGIIRLGSRVDVALPPTCRLVVREGDRVKAGISTLAEVAR